MMQIDYFTASDVGCLRGNNEDMAYANGVLVRDGSTSGTLSLSPDSIAAFAVADGMGGHAGGEVASEVVLRSFAHFMKHLDKGLDGDRLTESLRQWADGTNRLLLSTARTTPGLEEMGSTLVGLVFYEGMIALLNIGDSRCYRFQTDQWKCLSTDHSQRQLTGDPTTPSNLIYNFMGNDEEFFADVELLTTGFCPGATLLLCSDGLSDMLSEEEIAQLALQMPEELVQAAKRAGGRDNITVIALRMRNDTE